MGVLVGHRWLGGRLFNQLRPALGFQNNLRLESYAIRSLGTNNIDLLQLDNLSDLLQPLMRKFGCIGVHNLAKTHRENGVSQCFNCFVGAGATVFLVEKGGLKQSALLELGFDVVLQDALVRSEVLQSGQSLVDALQARHVHARLGVATHHILELLPLHIDMLLGETQLSLIGGHVALQASQHSAASGIAGA